MPRIPEPTRLPIVDAHIAHYGEANTLYGISLLLVPGFGLPELQALRTVYAQLGADIVLLDQGTLPNLRSLRDGTFGIDSTDVNGVWIRLTQYKKRVTTLLGKRNPLSRTVPNIGEVTIERYLTILRSFANHWALVNASLASPMVLGPFTIATLLAAIAAIDTKLTEIQAAIELLVLKLEQKEQVFGDEEEDERELTSIVARLLLYHSEIEARSPGQPIADSLPEIFPDGGAPLPTIPFNYVAQAGAVVKTWYNFASAPAGAAILFFKEGGLALTQTLGPAPIGGIQVNLWNGVTLVGDLDKFEIRNADGLTIARGVRDPSLPEPA